MATYTTNYNLYKPDTTDNFGDFRSEFNDNMDIIDANLGGGGGGGDSVSWTQKTASGTNIADITINGVTTHVYAPSGGGGGGVTTEMIYTGKEDEYHSDSSNTPMEFDTRTEGANFASYLSTSDHKTFTVLQDFACIVTFGIEQDPNLSSSNSPNCTFFVNGAEVFRVVTPSSSSGSNAVSAGTTILFAGDTFYWGSNNSAGYAVRLGQIDLLDGYDLTNYVKPSF